MDSKSVAIGTASGAAAGIAFGLALRGRWQVASGAIGAGLGALCAYKLQSRAEPWWHDEKQVRTFADVARDDADFQAAANAETFDASAEAEALHRLFEGASAAALTEACTKLNTGGKLDHARSRYQPWAAHKEKLGAAVHTIVDDLEAPHLKPSGIEQRLLGGVHASCWGLFTLMTHAALDEPKVV